MAVSARERAVGVGYSAGWSMVKALPAGVSARAFRAVADAAALRNGPGARQLRANLRRVVGPEVAEPDMDRLVGAALRSYSRYWLETFRLETMDHAAVADDFRANSTGLDNVGVSLKRGKGVVLALPHSGNWDASGVWLVDHYGPFTTVAERLKPDSVFDRFVAYRERLGMEVLALTGGERPPTEVLVERLKANGVVCLLADRDLSRKGVEVQFFGETARMPPGPALLAAMTGASLHTVHSFFVGAHGWGQHISEPIVAPAGRLRDRVITGTQLVADSFAAGIARKPEDWHMLQRLWVADLNPRPAVTDPADPASALGG